MERDKYKVLITTSGIGSRLKKRTQDRNKTLIEINNKPVIGHIIESYPADTSFVITTGYKGEDVKKYLCETYPQHEISFVEIDRYEGPGSSLGYSMLQAKGQLQLPFIFHCNDTLVTEEIPPPDQNWNGGAKGADLLFQNTQVYSSFKENQGTLLEIAPKGAQEFDLFHIGLVGINDYIQFWQYLNKLYTANPNDPTLNDVLAINLMIKNGSNFKVVEFRDWFDTGNLAGLAYAETHLKWY